MAAPSDANLGERQVDENDAALDDVQTEIGVDTRDDEAGGNRRREKTTE
jgi:hypothetical protein